MINQDYGKECDIWSTGVICFILLSGWAPFDGDTTVDIIKSIKKGAVSFSTSIWLEISAEAKDFVSQCLTTDPLKRITAGNALKHKWIKTA